jgi:hypothetical protein
MSKVIADITMSLDGYVTGPLADSHHGLGDVDELLAWVAEQDPVERTVNPLMVPARYNLLYSSSRPALRGRRLRRPSSAGSTTHGRAIHDTP